MERSHAWFVGVGRLRLRLERRRETHLALLQLAAALICLRAVDASFFQVCTPYLMTFFFCSYWPLDRREVLRISLACAGQCDAAGDSEEGRWCPALPIVAINREEFSPARYCEILRDQPRCSARAILGDPTKQRCSSCEARSGFFLISFSRGRFSEVIRMAES